MEQQQLPTAQAPAVHNQMEQQQQQRKAQPQREDQTALGLLLLLLAPQPQPHLQQLQQSPKRRLLRQLQQLPPSSSPLVARRGRGGGALVRLLPLALVLGAFCALVLGGVEARPRYRLSYALFRGVGGEGGGGTEQAVAVAAADTGSPVYIVPAEEVEPDDGGEQPPVATKRRQGLPKKKKLGLGAGDASSLAGAKPVHAAKKYDRNCFFSPVQCMLSFRGHKMNDMDEVFVGEGRRR